jgi:2'-5' RNA ligase
MKYLKSYKLFEEKNYEFGCVMIDVPVKNWNEITSFIDTDDIYTVSDNDTYGIQVRPHLTLLYGTHKEVTSEQVESLLKNVKPFSIEIDGVDIFENKDYDVVKFNIKKSDILQSIFDSLSTLPNSNSFKDYKPHITIAYVKKGTGKKYIKPDYKWKVDNINEVTYSMVDGNEYKFSLDSLNESNLNNKPHYDAEWKKPKNPIREMLEVDLRDILLEIEDLGYSCHLSGFITSMIPHVWISNKKDGVRQSINFDDIEDTVLRIEDYLNIQGFHTWREIINQGKKSEQLYIYFDLKQEPIKENKMWYKTIPQILNWLKEKSEINWLLLDTETTGLLGPGKEQLTQVSGILINYNFYSNTFTEIDKFDEKIKLTSDIKTRFNQPDGGNRKVLSFNHYGSGNYKYKLESDVLKDFFNWIDNNSPLLLVAQNAQFDMSMLSVRSGFKIQNEVFDTKMLIQLYFLPLIQKLSETDSKYKEMVDFIGTSPRDAGLISSSMSKIGPALGINMSGYHDALTDCRLMMDMFMKIVDILKDNQHIDISKYQLERIKVLR